MASPPTNGQPALPSGSNLNHNNNNNNNSSSVKKCGYLRKQKHGHKRFFVLREAGEGCPAARLEYYENEKKWKSKSAAAKRVIPLDSCLNINKRADAKNKYLIALYTRDEYFAVAAESELEQESWYQALTELLSAGRGEKDGTGCAGTGGCCYPSNSSCSNGCSSHLGLSEAPNYGLITPANAAYREIWQVNLKPKGLGQIKGLLGVYRLCLSARSISLLRLNSDTPSVTLQLTNIRRCGHSENLFFVEVGRSASTGAGEIWMQVDDTVVAQSIHETILEAMKAMRELVEFRPRSKSQSSSSNPISVPGRRHPFNQLPPSQTGIARRTRTDVQLSSSSSVASNSSARLRTASEGDSLSTKTVLECPLSPSILRAPLSRSHTLSWGGRHAKLVPAPGPLQHSRSMSMPVPRSPPSVMSPISLSSGSSGNGSTSDPLIPPRPSSCNVSASGSPSDTGFMSLDEYSSSPSELARAYLSYHSGTPDSVSDTPPHMGDLNGYMSMDRPFPGAFSCFGRRLEGLGAEKCPRKRTHSLTTPARQRVATPQVSSASLDETTLIRATYKGSPSLQSLSPKTTYHPYPEDYADVEIGRQEDDGYMPMTHGPRGDYVPMSPASVSAPQQILHPRNSCSESCVASQGDSPDGYMRMWCGTKGRPVSVHHKLSPAEPLTSFTPPDYFFMQPKNSCCYQLNNMASHSRSHEEVQPYVVMRSPISSSSHGRIDRPSRLALCTLPSMSEHPPEPSSPPGGEYIHIYFGDTRSQDPLSLQTPSTVSDCAPLSTGSPESSSSGSGPQDSPISDYMNLDFGPPSPKPNISSTLHTSSDYTEMSPRKITSSLPSNASPPPATPVSIANASSGVQHLTLLMDQISGGFNLHSPPPDPNRGAKLIRADPQGGRRRHSSETFSSTTQVTPVSPSFAHSPKRHSSASVENVSLRPGETLEPADCGSPMCRETSAGFQNGLNYIAIELSPEERSLLLLTQASSRGHLPALGLASLDLGSYSSIDFLGHRMKGATTVRDISRPLEKYVCQKLQAECLRPTLPVKVAQTPDFDPTFATFMACSGKDPKKGLEHGLWSTKDKLLDVSGPLSQIFWMADDPLMDGISLDPQLTREWAQHVLCLLGNENSALSTEQCKAALFKMDNTFMALATKELGPEANGLLFGDIFLKNLNQHVNIFTSLNKAQASM
ncbi:insulin receptor substrate 2 [Pelodytes ibericus]